MDFTRNQMRIADILRTIRTLSYLKPAQACYFIVRRFLPQRKFSSIDFPIEVNDLWLDRPISISGVYVNDTTFRFLNKESPLSHNYVEWHSVEASRLWLYNLHYFDYLREDIRSEENKEIVISSWIESNPAQDLPGWEPFPESLRIVNWVIYFVSGIEVSVLDGWLKSLYSQVLWLEKNLEKHILANHYFENLKALLFAGCYFKGKDAGRWREKAVKGLLNQFNEQTLSDGGHYERSPQYHCLMVENYLDIYNLAKNNSDYFDQSFVEQVKNVTVKGLDWVTDVLFPDKEIPLFNDSSFSIISNSDDLFEYANRLFSYKKKADKHAVLINKDDTGLYGWRARSDMFIIDCGDIGPSYQPGHTHCDFLSYELMLNEQRVIVNSGVYEYQSGSMRDYVRSTGAHNTITIDEDEQSELWGEFRVARRARKLAAGISKKPGFVTFSGAYRGFYQSGGKLQHRRNVKIELTDDERIHDIAIKDEISGLDGKHTIRSYIHFHPDISVEDLYGGKLRFKIGDNAIGRVHLINFTGYIITKSCYCPEFGVKLANPCIVILTESILPVETGYRIEVD